MAGRDLLLGLRRTHLKNDETPAKEKIYEDFRLTDTPQCASRFESVFPIGSLKNGEEAK